MSNSVLPKFSFDLVKMSNKVLFVGGPSSDNTTLALQLLQKKMKYGVNEGLVATGSPRKLDLYNKTFSEINPDHKIVIQPRIHKPSLLRFVEEAKRGTTKKRFVVIDSVDLKETNLQVLDSILDQHLNILLVIVGGSVYDFPELFRNKFDYVVINRYPVTRSANLTRLVQNSDQHQIKMPELIKKYQDKIIVLNNQEKVKDFESEGKVMLKEL